MGCFKVLKGKKKSSEQNKSVKRVNPQDHPPTALPEPPTHSRLQSAPPSFRDREEPVQPNNKVISTRTKSAPSRLDAADQDDLAIDYEEQEGSKSRFGSMKERQTLNPQPLPLPSHQNAAVLKNLGSFKVSDVSGPVDISGPLPLPSTLPQSHHSTGMLRSFSFEDIAAACNNFCPDRCLSESVSSIIFRASFVDDSAGYRRVEATVTRLNPSSQGLKEFINEVNTLARLQHPCICKLLGFHAREGSERRMLVYERLHHGSLDRLLYGRLDGPLIDWNARIKVALCAAQGLTFLHDEGPFQAMFHEFSTGNIQIDKDFSAKLSGYGCVSHTSRTDISSNPLASASLPLELQEKGLLTPKSNVWSFGIVLLELLTGRRNLDSRQPKEERNLIKWSRPYLSDDGRLSLIMDPQLKGRFPVKAARLVADLAQRCLQTDPLERPTMRTIVEHLKVIQQMKYTTLFPLQEPGAVSSKNMSRSPSLNGIITPAPRLSVSPSQPTRVSVSSASPLGRPLSLPPQRCLSTLI